MDEFNSETFQNKCTSNVGADNTCFADDVEVEDHQTEEPNEFGPSSAKKLCKLDKPKGETHQQMAEGHTGCDPPVTNPQYIPEHAGTTQSKNEKFQECVSVKPESVEDRSTFPSFRFMATKIKLGLCAADHPRVMLTTFQLETLSQLLLNVILGPEGQRVKPRFYGTNMVNGYLILICGDHTTASWVKELPKKLLLGDIRLKVVDMPSDNKTFVAVGHFPKSEHETSQRILKFLEIQNAGLDCSRWKVLDINSEKKSGVRMTFDVDWASAQLLKTKGPLLNFKFGGARFLLKTKRGVKFKEEVCEDDDFETIYSFPPMDEFVNPYGETEPFDYDPSYGMPVGSQMQLSYGGDPGGEYSARVAAVVKKAKTSLRNGFTSRERFQRNRKKKNKKKKKAKTEPN